MSEESEQKPQPIKFKIQIPADKNPSEYRVDVVNTLNQQGWNIIDDQGKTTSLTGGSNNSNNNNNNNNNKRRSIRRSRASKKLKKSMKKKSMNKRR
jgi:hypothetical protein